MKKLEKFSAYVLWVIDIIGLVTWFALCCIFVRVQTTHAPMWFSGIAALFLFLTSVTIPQFILMLKISRNKKKNQVQNEILKREEALRLFNLMDKSERPENFEDFYFQQVQIQKQHNL